jgi:hypothetical protein
MNIQILPRKTKTRIINPSIQLYLGPPINQFVTIFPITKQPSSLSLITIHNLTNLLIWINIFRINRNRLLQLLLCLTCFVGHLMILLIGSTCYLLSHEFFAMLMPLLIQIMASLIKKGLVWVFLLPTCRSGQQITYTSELPFKRYIVSSLLRRLP